MNNKPDTKSEKNYITLLVSPEQLKILGEILEMKGLGFPADQGIAVGTLLEQVKENLKKIRNNGA